MSQKPDYRHGCRCQPIHHLHHTQIVTIKMDLKLRKDSPQISMATTIGNSSNRTRFCKNPASCHVRGHLAAHHCLLQKAPNPVEPAASVNSSRSQLLMGPDIQRARPLNDSRNCFHTRKSSLCSLLRLTKCVGARTPAVAAASRRQKILPIGIMRQAKFSLPSRDCSWRNCNFRTPMVPRTSSFNFSNLSLGKRHSILIESISIPKNVINAVGPSVFSEASGTPNRSVRCCNVPNRTAQILDPAGPTHKKSSK